MKKQSPKTGPHRRTPSVTSLSLDPLNKEAPSPDKANGAGKTAHTPASGSGEKSVSPASKDAGKLKRRSRSSLGGAEDLVRGIDFGANTSPAEESKKHSYLLARGGTVPYSILGYSSVMCCHKLIVDLFLCHQSAYGVRICVNSFLRDIQGCSWTYPKAFLKHCMSSCTVWFVASCMFANFTLNRSHTHIIASLLLEYDVRCKKWSTVFFRWLSMDVMTEKKVVLMPSGGSRNVTRPGKASHSSNSPVRRTATTPPGTEKIIGRVSSTSILSPRKFVSPQRTISAVECLTMNGITNSNGDMELQSVRSELSAESPVADKISPRVTKDDTLVKGRSLVKGQQDSRPTRPGKYWSHKVSRVEFR